MPFSEKIKKEVMKKTFDRCSICQRLGIIQIHHIIPQSEGGIDDMNNAAPLCTTCHKIYGQNPLKRNLIREKRDLWYQKASVMIQEVLLDKKLKKGHIINNFFHREGVHCESSSLRDLFEYYDFPMSEAMAFGLDGTMGFGFFDTTNTVSFIPKSDIPFFIGGKQGTIEPNSLACRLLGISLRKQSFNSVDKAWEESKKLLNQNVPLILKVDIGYLPYFEGEGEFHFGGHTITLAGYDEEKGLAYVGDADFEGFQEVPIDLLKKCRSSEYGPKFMLPNNVQYSMTRRLDGKHPPLAAGVKLAIKEVVNNMLRPSVSSSGIQGLKKFANSIPNWGEKLKGTTKDPKGKDVSTARMMFELLHGYIETWGTGGAAFRNLYKEFLEELLNNSELKEGPKAWSAEDFKIIEECIPIIDESARHFTIIADTLFDAAEKYKDDCLSHVSLGELYDIALYIHSKEEELFKKLSKIKI